VQVSFPEYHRLVAMAHVSQIDLPLTLALVLFANQRPLAFDEIQTALTRAGYDVAPDETLHALNKGPFLFSGTQWVLAMGHD
jgi:hypothetical protein